MTNDDPRPDASHDAAVNQVLCDYMDGAAPGDPEAFLARHPVASRDPEVAEACRRFFAAEKQIDRVLESTAGPPGSETIDEGPLELAGFEVRELVGRGGMGVVYRARQLSVDRDVALKLLPREWALDENRLTRFRNEGQTLARLQAPHIVPVIDVYSSRRGPVLVMPFIEGRNLAQILSDRSAVLQSRLAGSGATDDSLHPWSRLSERDFLERLFDVFEQLLQALSAVHAEKLLHRDIKPSNILVDARGRTWLSDFGLVRRERPEGGASSGSRETSVPGDTVPGSVPGTTGYISPEARAGRELDVRSDLFACGVTIYQALTGGLPYERRFIKSNEPLPRRPSASLSRVARRKLPGLDATVFHALCPNRERRYNSAAELLEDLRLVRRGKRPRFAHLPPAEIAGDLWRRYRLRAAALLVIVPLVTWTFWSGGKGPVGPAPGLEPGQQEPAQAPAPTYAATFNVEPEDVRAVLIPLDLNGVPEVGRAISPSVSGSGKLAFSGVPVGNYLLEAAKDGFGFIQVYRRVPQPGTLTGQFRHLSWVFEGDSVCWHDLEVLRSPVEPGEMAYFEGDDEFQSGDDDNPSIALPKLLRKIEPFWLDTSEVTRGQIRMVLYESNVPKPPANEPDDDDYAAKRTPFDVAVAYAEKVGKRLPTELEFEYAATNRGRTRFPWGNDRWPGSPAWNFGGPVRTPAYDRTDTEPPCYGLMSNAVEWTSTWGPKEGDLPAETFRIVRGGPFEIVEGRQPPNPAEINPRHRFRVHSASLASDRFPQMGFRCARSERPLVLTYQPQ